MNILLNFSCYYINPPYCTTDIRKGKHKSGVQDFMLDEQVPLCYDKLKREGIWIQV
jgi:hypothetical protein